MQRQNKLDNVNILIFNYLSKIMNKFKVFLFAGIGFGSDWAINLKTGTNLDDPNLYFTPFLDVLSNATTNSSFNSYLMYYWQSQLPYLLLLIKISPIIPLIAAIITKDIKRNSFAYVAGMVMGLIIVYSLI
jgi:hypothetical protein